MSTFASLSERVAAASGLVGKESRRRLVIGKNLPFSAIVFDLP